MPKHLQDEFRITVHHEPSSFEGGKHGDDLEAHLHQKDPRFSTGWNKVGHVEGTHYPKGRAANKRFGQSETAGGFFNEEPDKSVLHILHSRLGHPVSTDEMKGNKPIEQDPKHLELRGRGLGLAMYEALMAHAKNALGATHVHGGTHSTMAAAAHQRLASKHGMQYAPFDNNDMEGEERGPFDSAHTGYMYALKSEQDLSKEEHPLVRPYTLEHEQTLFNEMQKMNEHGSQQGAKQIAEHIATRSDSPDTLLKLADFIAVDPAYSRTMYTIAANPHVTGGIMSQLIERQLSQGNVPYAIKLMGSPKADPRYVDAILDHMLQPWYRQIHYDIPDRIESLLSDAHEIPEETMNDLLSKEGKERFGGGGAAKHPNDMLYGNVLNGISSYARAHPQSLHPDMYRKIFNTLVDNNVETGPDENSQESNLSAMIANDKAYANDRGVPPRLGFDEIVKALPISGGAARSHPSLKGPDVQSKLQALVKSPDKNIREGVASAIEDPSKMYDDPDPFVQSALVRNIHTSPEHIVSLLGHHNRGVVVNAYNAMNGGGWIRGNTHLQNQAAKHLLANGERSKNMMDTAVNFAQPDTLDDMLNGKYHQDAAIKAMQAPNLSANQLERIFNLKESDPDEYDSKKFWQRGGPGHKFDAGYQPNDEGSKQCVHCGKTVGDHDKGAIEDLDPSLFHYEIDMAKKKASTHPNVAPERMDKIIDKLLGPDKNLADSVDLEHFTRKQKNLSPEQLDRIKKGVIEKYGKSPGFSDPNHTLNGRRMHDVLGEVVQHPNTGPATLEDMYKNHGYVTP